MPSKPLRKQADITSKVHAKAHVLKSMMKLAGHDLERACRGAWPQTDVGNKQDMTSRRHAKALVHNPIEETSKT